MSKYYIFLLILMLFMPIVMAEDQKISEMSIEDKKALLGLSSDQPMMTTPQTLKSDSYTNPEKYDLRDINGQNFATNIRSQSGCGACVAFAIIASVESTQEIYSNNSKLNPDLSEWDLFTRGGSCGSGWTFVPALNALKAYGVCPETCYPYLTSNSKCSKYSTQLTKVASWTQLKSIDEVKNWIVTKGPVATGMYVYEDFFNYDRGVYKAEYGQYMGNHAVAIVGYNDKEKYWICKNSWGTLWGESGWFKISYNADTNFGAFGFYGVSFTTIPVTPDDPPITPTTPPGDDVIVLTKAGNLFVSVTQLKIGQQVQTIAMTTPRTDMNISASKGASWTGTGFNKSDQVRFAFNMSDGTTLFSDRTLNTGKARKVFLLKTGAARWQVRFASNGKYFTDVILNVEVKDK